MSRTMAVITVLVMASATLAGGYQYQYKYKNKETLIIAVPVSPDYYYSVGDEEEKAERIAEKILSKIGTVETYTSRPIKLGRENFRLFGGNLSVDERVLTLLDTNCVRCHKPGAVKPGLPLLTNTRQIFAFDDQKKELRRREAVYESIENGDMPKGGPPLSNVEKTLVKEWVSQLKGK